MCTQSHTQTKTFLQKEHIMSMNTPHTYKHTETDTNLDDTHTHTSVPFLLTIFRCTDTSRYHFHLAHSSRCKTILALGLSRLSSVGNALDTGSVGCSLCDWSIPPVHWLWPHTWHLLRSPLPPTGYTHAMSSFWSLFLLTGPGKARPLCVMYCRMGSVYGCSS